ncbi:MAG: PAS domain S-box protein, partial [Rhodospirillaceae bacterium]|nr:PAS domain S-box protein [Rhodospirillaceae bacterium]
GSDGNVAPFRIFPLHLLKDLPKSWYAGKIVLIGADLPNEDRHRTPFAALLGNDAGSLPGVVVHAFALAQLLDGISFTRQDALASLLATLAASGLGVVIALLGVSVFARLMLGGLAYLAFWGTGFGLFALTGWLIPLFAPSLALAGAGSLSVAVMAQRYKRKKQFAEAMVHRRNESLHKVVENSFDGIIVTTSDGDITMTNSSADFLMGWKAGEKAGMPITDFIPNANDYGAHFFKLGETPDRLSERNIEPLEVPCERMDGTSFTMELVVYNARVSFTQGDSAATGGERVSYIYSFRDITARKRTEEAQKEALKESEAANRAKTEFLANMSHELRTPLNAIIGFSEIMKMEALGPIGTPQYVEYVVDIHNSGSHLIEIVNDILDMSKIEAGDIELNEEPCDVFQMADTCMRLVADRAQNGEVALVNTMESDLPRLFADQRMIKQILLNLLSNAVKFTPADGTVTLSAGVDGAGLTVSVSDTGNGIPAEKMAVILEPFGQADMTLQRQFEGTGLGLPLAKGMTELHGGSLTIESTEGKGTTASVSLPADRFVSEQKTA